MSHSSSTVVPATGFAGQRKSIFRPRALRSYADRDPQSDSHTVATPRSFYLLWAAAALVVLVGGMPWLVDIPVYIPAVAFIPAESVSNYDPGTITVLAAADQLRNLRIGENVVFKIDGPPYKVTATIFEVESELLGPQSAQGHFPSSMRIAAADRPRALARARIDQPISTASALLHGDRIDVWVCIGSMPAASLFSMTGRAAGQ